MANKEKPLDIPAGRLTLAINICKHSF